MRIRERLPADTFKPNYNSKTISFTNSQWLQQLLSIAVRLNNATTSHEYSSLSTPNGTTTSSIDNNNNDNNTKINLNASATTTTTSSIGTTGCIILQLYDKNPDFLYNQEEYQDIDYSVLKMQIIIWTQKYLKPDDLFMDWFETVNRHIHHNSNTYHQSNYDNNNNNNINNEHNELSVTNITFCTENLRSLMIEGDKQMLEKYNGYTLNGDIYGMKNETKIENYGVSEVQILIVITLSCVLIVCFFMAVILRIRSFCRRQSESRKQTRNDRDSALQVNFAYDVNETQIAEKSPIPSTTFGSNAYPRPMNRKAGVCRYNRIPPVYNNSNQKFCKKLNSHMYRTPTVFMIENQAGDRHNNKLHEDYSTLNQLKEIKRRHLLYSRQPENVIYQLPPIVSTCRNSNKLLKTNNNNNNNNNHCEKSKNIHSNKSIHRTNSF
ncbi:unnamed protein product [Trichobilharzia szidati]|nr:unnamed protein product [Trichobilharzia szidati]